MAKINVEHIDKEQQASEYVSGVAGVAEEPLPEVSTTTSHKRQKTLILSLVGLLLVFSGAAYLLVNRPETKVAPVSTETEQITQLSEAERLHQKLSQILDLPNETPSLATVQDAPKVSDQLFFTKAQNGDKVLIYVKAGQAVLYRPGTGKVINLAPIDIDTKSQAIR